ncbi:type II toxin-antitoxin system CcdA family antitoxin [Pseudomonas sp. KNUC1026]|uniref:type II toxin-antitoxin system CcdA family antitoxin n=1 Tax=Pseudomonas sp. KNUC1026 TaxID=2893890 RepID=UPI0022A6FF27|nr:type II toxin-antitoxin system CcdA family antitoxin [Pseudomonas sp. KNUC1026]
MSYGDDPQPCEKGSDDVGQSACHEWLVENRRAIERYNERCEEDGVFSDGLSSF